MRPKFQVFWVYVINLVSPVVLGALLSGCSPQRSTQDIFDNYLYRLANSLDVKRNDIEPSAVLPTYPSKRALTYPIPPLKINFLEFLKLSNCELQRLIGQRNSSLGKFISGYHSLLYHREFLLLAERCLAGMDKSASRYELLQQAVNHKTTYRDELYWNASFAGDEFRYLFSVSSQVFTPEKIADKPTDLIQALQFFNAWLGENSLDKQRLSQAYQTIEKTKWLGELRLTMTLAVNKLKRADALIQQRLEQRPLCYKPQVNRRFTIVKNVFYQFYIAEVQVLLSKLHQQAQELLALINQLQNKQKAHPAFATFWRQIYLEENGEWQQFNRAIESHTLSWQTLLKQCGFLPGK
ncbi:MAG: DUF3080 domain-containing protein [Cellvibrionaceae bacterium]|nr:DUF3080 domain-containing protein [Cellvibrionaceae bacterium]